jgi:uracil-DNA glycosylase
MKIPQKLLKIYKEFDNCERCKKENNPLLHILGGGKFQNPQFLFLFINPTHLNISSHRDYKGKRRYPFIGVRYFYRLLSEAGFLDKKTINDIYKKGWQIEDESRIEQSLINNNVYITNLVKCTKYNPDSPSKNIIKQDFLLLQKEINVVLPKYIIAFGKLPLEIITSKNIRLKDYLEKIKDNSYEPIKSVDILGKIYNVLPCYFPVGRGNRQGALEILNHIRKRYVN